MVKKYIVTLTTEELAEITALTHKGRVSARRLMRANILRLAHSGATDEAITAALQTSVSTVERIRQRFVEGGLTCALQDEPRSGRPEKLDGKQHAFLIALACSDPPTGHECWTMQLLADALVERCVVHEPLSDETVRRILKANDLKPWLRAEWCVPTVSAEFVWRMEDVLDLYAEPYSPQFPVVCFDERPYQLTSETRHALPAEAGTPRRYDYEYRREGTCNLFTSFQPLRGWRHVAVTGQRTRPDFAQQMQRLSDVDFPDAECIRVVLDNLNTHCPSTLYDVLPAAEARRIVKRLEFHYTPKHGSWLNMAETELAVLSRQCLDRRLGETDQLYLEVAAWERERNLRQATVRWQFQTSDARTNLARLYPSQLMWLTTTLIIGAALALLLAASTKADPRKSYSRGSLFAI